MTLLNNLISLLCSIESFIIVRDEINFYTAMKIFASCTHLLNQIIDLSETVCYFFKQQSHY
jgi:hypothetical protein